VSDVTLQVSPAPLLPGCAQCRKGAYGASWPPPELIAVNGDGPVYLHQCSICSTFWQFDQRFANPVPEMQARKDFPAYFTDWSPRSGEPVVLKVRSGARFPMRDVLTPGGEAPEGKLEELLAAHSKSENAATREGAAALMPLLRNSLLQVPSTREPATDGSGMTPMALNRPPVVWILAFTRLELARRFAGDARWCVELYASDLVARLSGFGLHLNFGAGSERQIPPIELQQRK
jgi:hypothetical protein